MRVLLVTEASSAGVGRHVMDLAGGLLQRGHETHLVYSERRVDEIFQRDLRALPGLQRAKIDMRRGPHPSDLRALRQLYAYVIKHGPFDICHAQSSKAGALARMPFKRLAAGVVYTPHCVYTMNPSISRYAFWLFKGIERQLAKACDRIIAVSPDERTHLIDLGFPAASIELIPNGVDPWPMPSRAAARRQLELPDGPIVGFVGRLNEQKDPLRMIATFAEAKRQLPSLRLAMVGDGPLLQPAQARAQELGVDDYIHWLGFRSARDVLPAIDLLALTSSYEGLPYVLIESLVAGVPVVSTPVGGAELIIGSSGCGRIAGQGSPTELAAGVVALLQRDADYRNATAAARSRAREFSISAMVERTLATYRECAAPTEERTSA